MHYPLSELAPEATLTYKPLKGIVHVPQTRVEGSQTIFLPGEEITGEFLGEMKSVEQGVAALNARSCVSIAAAAREGGVDDTPANRRAGPDRP